MVLDIIFYHFKIKNLCPKPHWWACTCICLTPTHLPSADVRWVSWTWRLWWLLKRSFRSLDIFDGWIICMLINHWRSYMALPGWDNEYRMIDRLSFRFQRCNTIDQLSYLLLSINMRPLYLYGPLSSCCEPSTQSHS